MICPHYHGPRPAPAFARSSLLAALLLALLLALGACSDAPPRKRSFIASAEGVRTPEQPVGLNPLGTLDTCRPGATPDPLFRERPRVLVSRPEAFTREASEMIQTLREALSEPSDGLPPVRFLLSPRPITAAEEARLLGRACEALIVLWEPHLTKTLELTLPDPAQVPLRDLVQERLCEFGDHREQLRILYLTIAGLLSLRDNEYDRASLYMETARAIDNRCLHLPGARTTERTPSPQSSP